MNRLFLTLCFQLVFLSLSAQSDSLAKTRFVVGLSAPELLHLGINLNISKSSQVGFAAGIGPTWGGTWPTLNLEHRLYIGKINEFTNRKIWFVRQGGTYFTAGKEGAATLTVGADFKNRHRNRGWTIDAGAFILFRNRLDYSNLIYPALRFQYYSYFKKATGKN